MTRTTFCLTFLYRKVNVDVASVDFDALGKDSRAEGV